MSRRSFAAKAFARVTMALLAGCVFIASAHAGPANPAPFVISQPDGTRFTARLVGDEWSNGHETSDGYAILRDRNDNYWKYADQGPGGTLVLTPLVVARDAPAGLQKGLRASPPARAFSTDAIPAAVSAVGTRPTLVILAQFGNKAGITTAAQWQARFFGATNSVKHHYAVSSYNQTTIAPAAETNGTAGDGIVGWVTVGATHPNTAGNTNTANQRLTKDAILAADPFVNFAAYDTNGDDNLSPSELMVIVIVAGNETAYGGSVGSCSPSVWGHKWAVFSVAAPVVDTTTVGAAGYAQFGEMHCATSNPPGQIATIGIMAHEIGHLLGLPDLYDTDSSSAGIGDWSLMAGGSWNRVTRAGDSPSLLDAWSKAVLGWVTPTLVQGTLVNESIQAADTSSTVYQFLAGSAAAGTGEYFLLENRQRTSYDVGLPGAGLLIWHVDEARTSNANECIPGGSPACSTSNHYKVALIQADGAFNLERNQNSGDDGDPFPGDANNRSWSAFTSPDSRLWSGATSDAAVTDISDSSPFMTATLSAPSSGLPSVSISVNGSHGTVTPPRSGPLEIAIAASGGSAGFANPSDLYFGVNIGGVSWWVTPQGSFSSTQTRLYRGPLASFGPATIMALPSAEVLPNGTYVWFVFVVNGTSGVVYDTVTTVIAPAAASPTVSGLEPSSPQW
jgi:M6 family metalloprotease-like protein